MGDEGTPGTAEVPGGRVEGRAAGSGQGDVRKPFVSTRRGACSWYKTEFGTWALAGNRKPILDPSWAGGHDISFGLAKTTCRASRPAPPRGDKRTSFCRTARRIETPANEALLATTAAAPGDASALSPGRIHRQDGHGSNNTSEWAAASPPPFVSSSFFPRPITDPWMFGCVLPLRVTSRLALAVVAGPRLRGKSDWSRCAFRRQRPKLLFPEISGHLTPRPKF